MDVLTNIVKYSEPPLSDAMINTVFPLLVKLMLSSDDNSVLQVRGQWPEIGI